MWDIDQSVYCSSFLSFCIADVDECQKRTHNCHASMVCRNRPGRFYCECQQGYRRGAQGQCEGTPTYIICRCTHSAKKLISSEMRCVFPVNMSCSISEEFKNVIYMKNHDLLNCSDFTNYKKMWRIDCRFYGESWLSSLNNYMYIILQFYKKCLFNYHGTTALSSGMSCITLNFSFFILN